MLHAIASAFIGVAAFISSLFGGAPAPAQAPAPRTLGAALPSGTAVFETSLQSRISSTGTSMTLVSNSVRGGSSLSGYNCFTIDEGRTDAEYVCGTVSGTSVTSMTRGLDPATGTSTNSALRFAHRVGANVKITDFPLLQILRNQASGADTYEHALTYASGVTPANTGDLTDKEYVDGIAFSGAGVIDARSIAKGVVELATSVETASSTSAGTSGTLVIPASSATSTYNSATAPLRVVVTQNSGKIDSNFIATSTLFSATTSLSVGAFPVWQIGKQQWLSTTTGTSTFSVPSGITKVFVEVVGGGGAGGGASGGGGAGGGSGAYAYGIIDLTGTSSVQYFVGSAGTGAVNNAGSAGTWSTFGSNGYYMKATGGAGASATPGGVGAGGTASGGLVNLSARSGFPFASTVGGAGGIAPMWGPTYGEGGAGCYSGGGTCAGSAGAQGVVIVRW
jgi:hypothetical protein